MKASLIASAVAALLATDAKPSETAITAAILAADKKAKDGEFGEKKDQPKAGDEKEMKEGADEKDDKKEGEDEFPPKDKDAKDSKDDPEGTDEEMDVEDEAGPNAIVSGAKKPAVDKKGMDAAIKRAISANDALHAARRAVQPILGEVAYDSAAAVYKAALDKLGVPTADVHASAYPAMLKLATDRAAPAVIVGDSAAATDMLAAIPGLSRIRR